jgi:hypothetical protein
MHVIFGHVGQLEIDDDTDASSIMIGEKAADMVLNAAT